MRIAHVLTLAGAAAISFSAAAEPASVNGSQEIASVPVVAQPQHKLRAEEVDGLQGVYGLSDGRVLHVTLDRGRLYAQVGDTRTEIVPAGANKFASRDDAMRLKFDDMDFTTTVTLDLAAN